MLLSNLTLGFLLKLCKRAISSSSRETRGEPVGVHANAAMWVDPYLKNTCMLDPVGGSVSFYDTKVRLEKVSLNGRLGPSAG